MAVYSWNNVVEEIRSAVAMVPREFRDSSLVSFITDVIEISYGECDYKSKVLITGNITHFIGRFFPFTKSKVRKISSLSEFVQELDMELYKEMF